MKKFLALTALSLMAFPAFALQCPGTVWSSPADASLPAPGTDYCVAIQTSGTTSTQLGKILIDPTKQITYVGGVSGSSMSGHASTTLTFYVGNRAIATQTVSNTTAGNVVQLGYLGVPYYTGITVSQSNPGLISSTNANILTFFEAPRALSTK